MEEARYQEQLKALRIEKMQLVQQIKVLKEDNKRLKNMVRTLTRYRNRKK